MYATERLDEWQNVRRGRQVGDPGGYEPPLRVRDNFHPAGHLRLRLFCCKIQKRRCKRKGRVPVMIKVDISNVWGSVEFADLMEIEKEVSAAHASLHQ